MQPRNPNNSRGVDVSHHQGIIDWARVAADDIEFAIIKATEGATIQDQMFQRNLTGAKAAGLFVGAYHFLKASTADQAVVEANSFIAAVNAAGGFDQLDFPPVLDFEDDANTPTAATAWLQRVQAVCGRQPLIYTYPAFIDDHPGSYFAYPLWYASYGVDQPADRGGWSEWTLLQYSEKGTVTGISGPVDLDEFNGRLSDMFAELKAQNEALAKRVVALEAVESMSVPTWAKEAVDAAAKATGADGKPIVANPDGGSLDFYRILTVLHHKGII